MLDDLPVWQYLLHSSLPKEKTGTKRLSSCVASMYGSCTYIGHTDSHCIVTAACWLVTGCGWRAKSTSVFGTDVVGHLEKARLSQLMDSSSRTSLFLQAIHELRLELFSSQKRGDTLCKH